MANPEAPRSPDGPSPSNPLVTRRRVLGGMAGIAGLASVPSLLAACGPGATTAPISSAAGGSTPPAASTPPASSGPAASLTGEVTLGSNYSDAVPKKAMQAAADSFKAKTGISVKINTVDHGTFQDQISSYLQGTPDDVWTWFSGFRMRFFAAQGLACRLLSAKVVTATGTGYKGVRMDNKEKAVVAEWQVAQLAPNDRQAYTLTLSKATAPADLKGSIHWKTRGGRPAGPKDFVEIESASAEKPAATPTQPTQ